MTVKVLKKNVSMNPLKISQPLGGALALQGFFKSMPILHGSQGCAAFAKSLMTRHFREPIAMQTTALQEMNVIFGAGKSLHQALDKVIEKHNPEFIGVLSTALTEVAGDDLQGNIKEYLKKKPLDDPIIFGVSLPDFKGSLETGYSKTVENLVDTIIKTRNLPKKTVRNRVNLLPAAHLTPGDVMEVKEILYQFGCEVITIPDLSASLSGHLLTGYSALSRGGVPIESLQQMLTAELTLVIGSSMEPAAKLIKNAGGVPYRVFPSLTGLKVNDDFFSFLQTWKRKKTPIKYLWQRENLLDCMLDAHFYFGGKSAAVALEPDHLYAITGWLKEMGISLQGIVSSIPTPILKRMEEEVWIGDLGDLEDIARGVNLWISNSHGKQGAERIGAHFIPLGFPVFDRLGTPIFTSIGYRGTTDLLIRVGNQLLED